MRSFARHASVAAVEAMRQDGAQSPSSVVVRLIVITDHAAKLSIVLGVLAHGNEYLTALGATVDLHQCAQ